MKSNQKSLIEIKSALRPTPEPVETFDNENSLSREIIIIGVV